MADIHELVVQNKGHSITIVGSVTVTVPPIENSPVTLTIDFYEDGVTSASDPLLRFRLYSNTVSGTDGPKSYYQAKGGPIVEGDYKFVNGENRNFTISITLCWDSFTYQVFQSPPFGPSREENIPSTEESYKDIFYKINRCVVTPTAEFPSTNITISNFSANEYLNCPVPRPDGLVTSSQSSSENGNGNGSNGVGSSSFPVWIIILIVVVLVLAIGGGVAGFVLYRRRQNVDDVE